VWAVDFQFGVTTDGQPITIVSIVDEHTRECLGGMIDRNITGEHLIGELDRLAAERHTFPTVLRCDNGPELACGAMADWAAGQVGLHFIPRGAVAQRLRRVIQLPHPRRMSQHQQLLVIGDWKHDYNHHRRHSSLGYEPPAVTLPAVPTNERLSFAVDQFMGSGHTTGAIPIEARFAPPLMRCLAALVKQQQRQPPTFTHPVGRRPVHYVAATTRRARLFVLHCMRHFDGPSRRPAPFRK